MCAVRDRAPSLHGWPTSRIFKVQFHYCQAHPPPSSLSLLPCITGCWNLNRKHTRQTSENRIQRQLNPTFRPLPSIPGPRSLPDIPSHLSFLPSLPPSLIPSLLPCITGCWNLNRKHTRQTSENRIPRQLNVMTRMPHTVL